MDMSKIKGKGKRLSQIQRGKQSITTQANEFSKKEKNSWAEDAEMQDIKKR